MEYAAFSLVNEMLHQPTRFSVQFFPGILRVWSPLGPQLGRLGVPVPTAVLSEGFKGPFHHQPSTQGQEHVAQSPRLAAASAPWTNVTPTPRQLLPAPLHCLHQEGCPPLLNVTESLPWRDNAPVTGRRSINEGSSRGLLRP